MGGVTVREVEARHINAGFDQVQRLAANPGSFVLPGARPKSPIGGQVYYDDKADVEYIYNSRNGWRER